MTLEISTHLGDTLLDVTTAEDYTLCDRVLVQDGLLVAPATGRVGLVDYAVREITRAPRSLPFTRADEHRLVPYLAAALLVHVGVWALATTTAPHVEPVAQPSPRPRLVARIAASPSAATVPDDRARDRADTKAGGTGRAAAGDAGTAGSRSAKPRGHIAVQNTGEVPQLAKADAVARARRAGILGQSQVLEETLANLAGSDKLTSAFDSVTVNAAIGGSGDAAGTFGTTYAGNGAGGGGVYGTIGTGRAGSVSLGTSGGHGWGGAVRPVATSWDASWDGRPYSYVPLPYRRRPAKSLVQICPRGTRCTVEGSLDPAIVRRYVRRNVQQLSYCYEKELLARPHIRGQLQISFEVKGDGATGNLASDGFDADVTACVHGVFARLELPRGGALVTYTLRFGPNR